MYMYKHTHTEKEHQGLFSNILMGFLVTVFYWFWYFANSPQWTYLEQLFISWLYSHAVCYNYFWKDPKSFSGHLFRFPVTRCRKGEPLQGHDYSVSLEVCLGSPFMASAPPHPHSLILLHLLSKDHHSLCFQRPFFTAPSTAVLVEKASPPPQGGVLFDPVELRTLQPLG